MATRHLMTDLSELEPIVARMLQAAWGNEYPNLISELEPIVARMLQAAWDEGHSVGYGVYTQDQIIIDETAKAIDDLCSLDETVKAALETAKEANETARKDLVAASKAE